MTGIPSTSSSRAVATGAGEMDYAAWLAQARWLTSGLGYIEVDTLPDGLAAAAGCARFFGEHR